MVKGEELRTASFNIEWCRSPVSRLGQGMDFSSATVLCVGDVMLDRFVHGAIERISPEAPVPVLRTLGVREMLGGTGNVANNVAALGAQAVLVGLLGEDDSADRIRSLSAKVPTLTQGLVVTGARPTICKTRFIAGQQQVVRADQESDLPLQPEEEEALLAQIAHWMPAASAVILSDYGKGVLGRTIVERTIAIANRYGKAVFVDPKTDDFSRYRGATCITPNLKELAAASHMPVGDDLAVEAAGRAVMVGAQAAAILATRSEKGMMLIEREGGVHSVPARTREVFDVSGAGDTVIATLAVAHASGRSLVQAMRIANAAAGVVVSKLGTATATVAEVLHELHEQDGWVEGRPKSDLATCGHAEAMVSRWRCQGLTVGFTNGCFDVLHAGHVALIEAARAQCDRLIVGLNTDASVSRLKGPNRPINSLTDRAAVIAALRHVDCTVAFDEDTPLSLIKLLLPDVLIKGADYTEDTVVGGDLVTAAGGRLYLAPLLPGRSTTTIIARLPLVA